MTDETKGLYVAVRYIHQSALSIKKFLLDAVPNSVSIEELHTTIIYSKKFDDVPLDEWALYPATIKGYEIWNAPYYGGDILVAVLDSDKLEARHKFLMNNYNLDYSYDTYIPHITISKNIPKDFDHSRLPKFMVIGSDEYSEELR